MAGRCAAMSATCSSSPTTGGCCRPADTRPAHRGPRSSATTAPTSRYWPGTTWPNRCSGPSPAATAPPSAARWTATTTSTRSGSTSPTRPRAAAAGPTIRSRSWSRSVSRSAPSAGGPPCVWTPCPKPTCPANCAAPWGSASTPRSARTGSAPSNGLLAAHPANFSRLATSSTRHTCPTARPGYARQSSRPNSPATAQSCGARRVPPPRSRARTSRSTSFARSACMPIAPTSPRRSFA